MSKYTTEVRYICEMNSGFPVESMGDHTPDEIISAARENIFNFTYPVYDADHKPELETKILKHYYTREIAPETVGLWKLWLNDTLNLIMPKYNKLYAAEHSILTKELKNIDVETHTVREDDFTRTDNLTDTSSNTRTDNLTDTSSNTRTDNLTDTSSNTRTDNLRQDHDAATTDKYSDTPQGSISGVDNNTYLTDYRVTDVDESTTNTGTQTNAGSVTHTGTQGNTGSVTHTGTQGNTGSVTHTGTQKNAGDQEISTTEEGYRGSKLYAELLSEYAEKVLNIDMMIVNDLSDLFIKLW